MDRLEAMSTFLAVVEEGSLSATARRLKTPLPTVSRKISELESHLRTKLFNRSSRQLVLTDAGSSYLAACKRILADVTEAERTASGEYAAPTGELSVTTPIGPWAHDSDSDHGGLPQDLSGYQGEDDSQRSPAQSVSGAYRCRRPPRRLAGFEPESATVGTTCRVACASPAYLAARGTPRKPEDLAGHDCIRYAGFSQPDAWTFVRDKATIAVPVHTRLFVGSAEAAYAAARAGIGITIALSYQLDWLRSQEP